MPFVKATPLLVLGALATVGALAAAGWVWSGVYDISADDSHTRPVHAALTVLRERSIRAHARDIEVPDLADPALIRQGAGNYAAMCTGCHLAPGMAPTELSRGLYPAPPNLSRAAVGDPAPRFWVIKHGIKASGLPAWGRTEAPPSLRGPAADGAPPGAGTDHHATAVAHHAPATASGAEHAATGHDDAAPAASEPVPAAGSHPHPPGMPADHHAVTAPASRTASPPAAPAPATVPAPPASSATPAPRAPSPTTREPATPEPTPAPAPTEPAHDHSSHRH